MKPRSELIQGDVRELPVWIHPKLGERGSDFCRHMGWGPGDVLLHSVSADGRGVPDNPKRYTLRRFIDDEWRDCDVEFEVGGFTSRMNMVIGGLRTGSLVGDPVVCWPWALAPVPAPGTTLESTIGAGMGSGTSETSEGT